MTHRQLRQARFKLDLTQKQMAKLLKTPYSTYCKQERGESRVPGTCEIAVKCLLKEIA